MKALVNKLLAGKTVQGFLEAVFRLVAVSYYFKSGSRLKTYCTFKFDHFLPKSNI